MTLEDLGMTPEEIDDWIKKLSREMQWRAIRPVLIPVLLVTVGAAVTIFSSTENVEQATLSLATGLLAGIISGALVAMSGWIVRNSLESDLASFRAFAKDLKTRLDKLSELQEEE